MDLDYVCVQLQHGPSWGHISFATLVAKRGKHEDVIHFCNCTCNRVQNPPSPKQLVTSLVVSLLLAVLRRPLLVPQAIINGTKVSHAQPIVYKIEICSNIQSTGTLQRSGPGFHARNQNFCLSRLSCMRLTRRTSRRAASSILMQANQKDCYLLCMICSKQLLLGVSSAGAVTWKTI